jgi:predicted O-methyltransferase YrrM
VKSFAQFGFRDFSCILVAAESGGTGSSFFKRSHIKPASLLGVSTLTLMHRVQSSIAKAAVGALRFSGLYEGYWQHWRGDLFDYAERAGIHILPVHYYSPIPSQSDFSRKRRPNRMTGIDLDISSGAARADFLLKKYKDQIANFLEGPNDYNPTNSGFHPLDAALLYASVSEAKPKRIVEIGSGMSTFVIANALRDQHLAETNFTCIEPFLPEYLRLNRETISEIIERPLQEVPIERFSELEANDILFIDSTHVVRFDSDVVYEILEILPVLKAGVIIHIHDIFLPDDYPEAWLKRHRYFWSEQYMLQAFLSMNPHFKIEIPVHAVKQMLPSDDILQPASSDVEAVSLWMRRI